MLSYEPWAQTSSYGCMRLEMPTTPRNVLRRYVTQTAQMPTIPQKKILGYVTLALNMPMPTPCFLVLVTLRSESCPSVAYMTVFIICVVHENI